MGTSKTTKSTKILVLKSFRLYGVRLHVYIIKTHGSESWGQEEAGLCDEQVNYLQVAPL